MKKELSMVGLAPLLKKEGRTRAWLKDKVGVSYPTIKSWENGDSEPRISQLDIICEELNCEKEELYHNK